MQDPSTTAGTPSLGMKTILIINGGSSSIKFAVFESTDSPHKILAGEVQRVGQPGTVMSASGLGDPVDKQPVQGGNHSQATNQLIDWLKNRLGDRPLCAIGHRIVHGGFHLIEHQIITSKVMKQLKEAAELDPAHLPREIGLIEAFGRGFPGVSQTACFDTAFFKDLPTIAKLLPIPRKYFEKGVHRFGFHGLSYTYLISELRRLAGDAVADGKVILAHLGSGASMAAIKNGKPIDTSMSFTPTAGLVMGTRSGDLDPGLIVYLLRNEKLSVDQLDDLLNKKSGLLGVSGTSADMRDLSDHHSTDSKAAEAVDLFCYQAKKFIGSYAAAMGGVDTIVFAGGIGENSAAARAGICTGLEFLGIEIEKSLNLKNKSIISKGNVIVRVIATDEETVIARETIRLSKIKPTSSACENGK
jgi:acetate kinase